MTRPRRSWPFGRRQTLADQYARRQISYDQYRALLRQRLLKRVEYDISRGNTERAISRLESSMSWFNTVTRRRLATLYMETGQLVRAGKYWYLLEHLTEAEQAAVAAFTQSVGNCPLGVCRKLTPQQFFSYHTLDYYAIQQYANLIDRIGARFGHVPNFLTAFKSQLDKFGLKPPGDT
ncbi:DUF6584 family protein [Hymenobacter koreensis]